MNHQLYVCVYIFVFFSENQWWWTKQPFSKLWLLVKMWCTDSLESANQNVIKVTKFKKLADL